MFWPLEVVGWRVFDPGQQVRCDLVCTCMHGGNFCILMAPRCRASRKQASLLRKLLAPAVRAARRRLSRGKILRVVFEYKLAQKEAKATSAISETLQ